MEFLNQYMKEANDACIELGLNLTETFAPSDDSILNDYVVFNGIYANPRLKKDPRCEQKPADISDYLVELRAQAKKSKRKGGKVMKDKMQKNSEPKNQNSELEQGPEEDSLTVKK